MIRDQSEKNMACKCKAFNIGVSRYIKNVLINIMGELDNK